LSGLSGNTLRESSWRRLDWNGIGFEVPAGWQIGLIESRYLLLENEGVPVVEVKWNRIRGRFSPRRMLRRISAGQPPGVRKSIRVQSPPSSWYRALEARQVTGFTWQTAGNQGQGVLLFCPACATATVIQFLGPQPDPDLPLRLLKSFRDHFSRKGVPLSVYDIAALIPPEFQIKTHRFDAGLFELHYTGPGRSGLSLFRWAPAAVLLQQRALADFFVEQMQLDARNIIQKSERTLEAVSEPALSGPLGWVGSIRRRPKHVRVRLWHLPEHNRILAVRLEGVRPTEPELFERICNHYGVV
jgi:hypothetical protein